MLILLRHGRTEANRSGLLQGRVDNPLDETGLAQARQAAAAIGPVDAVVSSPLSRARDTAAALGREVEVDERWIELAYGDLEGRALDEVPVEVWESWRSDPDFAPGGGESHAQVDVRVHAALADLAERSAERNVVVVSHVSPIKSAVAWALGTGPEIAFRCHLSTGSISRIAFRRGTPVLVSFNETAHLA